jgi:hypothetical protein
LNLQRQKGSRKQSALKEVKTDPILARERPAH